MTDLKSLVGVAVLYKCSFEKSNTIVSLNKSLEKINLRMALLVYDNGPEKQSNKESFEYGNLDIVYKHDPENPGISKAYNEGVEFATGRRADWILLLDQDTIYSSNFFESYIEATAKGIAHDILCIIPKVLSDKDNTLLSPSKFCRGGITRPIKRIIPGIIEKPITSINAGTFISTQFVKSIGGFNNAFPLDMLDHWYFREIKNKNKKVLLLDTYIHHDLSVISFFDKVSISRYDNILLSEREFFKDHVVDLIVYKLRLVIRFIKQLLAGEKEYAKLTLKSLIK